MHLILLIPAIFFSVLIILSTVFGSEQATTSDLFGLQQQQHTLFIAYVLRPCKSYLKLRRQRYT
jgi:hypothetical protein